jgi:hypothetical protein
MEVNIIWLKVITETKATEIRKNQRKTNNVAPRGVEPLISRMRTWRPRPLDDGAIYSDIIPDEPIFVLLQSV